jgi:hypothetical protein
MLSWLNHGGLLPKISCFLEEHPDFFVDKYGRSRTPTFDIMTMEEVLDAVKAQPFASRGICNLRWGTLIA